VAGVLDVAQQLLQVRSLEGAVGGATGPSRLPESRIVGRPNDFAVFVQGTPTHLAVLLLAPAVEDEIAHLDGVEEDELLPCGAQDVLPVKLQEILHLDGLRHLLTFFFREGRIPQKRKMNSVLKVSSVRISFPSSFTKHTKNQSYFRTRGYF
jgi:hypothetical protein